jgi:acetyl esterase
MVHRSSRSVPAASGIIVMTTVRTEDPIRVEETSPMPLRIYRRAPTLPGAPVLLHLHGGAFVAGGLDNGRTVATLLADAGAVVVSVEYPLAPRHPFPEALEATFQTLSWLHRNRAKLADRKSRILVAGEEAGGNLAAGLTLMARDQQGPLLAGQILLSPMLDPRLATCSMREAEAGPVGCKWADGWHQYLGSADKAAHPYASPVTSSRLAGLAPALVLTAEDDLLRDEAVNYAGRLRDAGVTVHEHVLPGPTGWPCAFHDPASAPAPWTAAVRERLARFFAAILGLSDCAAPLRPLHT